MSLGKNSAKCNLPFEADWAFTSILFFLCIFVRGEKGQSSLASTQKVPKKSVNALYYNIKFTINKSRFFCTLISSFVFRKIVHPYLV